MKKKIQPIVCIFTLMLTFCCNSQNGSKPLTHDTTVSKEMNVPEKNEAKQSADQEKDKPKTCIDAVMKIMETSPSFRKVTKGLNEAIIKNGGTGYGILIESSPNPTSDGALDYSATYNFKLQEEYSDRTPVVARYTYNPVKQQLYEYHADEDTLIPIAFDKKLLTNLNEQCK
jgi:hypothetical protein